MLFFSDVIELEKATCQIIETVIIADQKELNKNHMTLSQIQHVLQQMTVTIATYQMKNLSTVEIKTVILKLIVHCMNKLNSNQLQGTVIKPVKETLTAALIKILGTTDNCQVLVN